jgi:putative flippase GtrA
MTPAPTISATTTAAAPITTAPITPGVTHDPGARRVPSLIARLGGSMLVSVATTLWSLSILAGLTASHVVSAGTANVVATLAGIPWSYWLNRRYVWRRTGPGDLRREVVPFATMCVAALIASTLVVESADGWAAGAHLATLARTSVVVAANVATFGALWVVQFLVLDRVLFHDRPHRSG